MKSARIKTVKVDKVYYGNKCFITTIKRIQIKVFGIWFTLITYKIETEEN